MQLPVINFPSPLLSSDNDVSQQALSKGIYKGTVNEVNRAALHFP
jgi:hypothetical protein